MTALLEVSHSLTRAAAKARLLVFAFALASEACQSRDCQATCTPRCPVRWLLPVIISWMFDDDDDDDEDDDDDDEDDDDDWSCLLRRGGGGGGWCDGRRGAIRG
eukprot:COSAG01_NODE_429_length_17183_cov_22.990869_14_plen_104_part_00